MSEQARKRQATLGCLVGTAIGDSIALPFEGFSKQRIAAFRAFPLKQRLFAGRGFASDDTEHTCMVVSSFIDAHGSAEAFQTLFARRLRWWLLGLPAGVGLATLRSCLKLWIGIRPPRSAVVSAGNGPAMRSAILGVLLDDVDDIVAFARASATITHADSRAVDAAVVVAIAGHLASRDSTPSIDELLSVVSPYLERTSAVRESLEVVKASLDLGETPTEFCGRSFGDSVSGFVMQTLPACLHAWLSHSEDYESAVSSIVACGGDADTTAAIVGALVGARTGVDGIPSHWVDRYADWPRSIRYLEALAAAGTASERVSPRVNPIAIVLRNIFFTSVVLSHGFRRLAPPYR